MKHFIFLRSLISYKEVGNNRAHTAVPYSSTGWSLFIFYPRQLKLKATAEFLLLSFLSKVVQGSW